MLTRIREKATGWIAWAIVILITIPFALWGVNSYFTEGSYVNVAEFDGGEIDYQSYQNALYQERNRLRQRFGQGIDPVLLSGGVLGRQVITSLVADRLLVQDVLRQGYRVSDEQLLEAILAEEAFRNEDGFSQQLYERMVRLSGYSPAEFEAVQRNSAAIQQLQTGYVETSFAIDREVEHVLGLIHQERTGEYAVIDSTRLLPEIDVKPEEVESEYEENKSAYRVSERVKVDYIEISLSDFAQGYRPSDETLRNLYDVRSAQFRKDEQRSVSHILLEVQEKNEDEVEEEARRLIERIHAGEDFADLAREHSADVGSAESGGSIGWINKGVTGPEFEAAAFALAAGQISDPVRSNFGIHIIRVDEIRLGEVKEFEEVREELVAEAVRSQSEAEMFEVSEELANIVYEQPESLEPAANQLGLSIKVSDWFSRSEGMGIGANSAVRAAAFGEEVLNEGFNSGVINLGDDRQAVLRKNDYRESNQLSLEDVKAQITEQLLISKSIESAENLAKELVAQLESGRDWIEILSENGLQAATLPRSFAEVSDVFLQGLLNDVFAAGKPRAGGEVYGYGHDGNIQYSIFRITGASDGDTSQATDSERHQIQQSVRYRFGDSLFENYLANLTEDVDIQINEELL